MVIDNIETQKDPTLAPAITPTTRYCKPSVTSIKDHETARKLKEMCKGNTNMHVNCNVTGCKTYTKTEIKTQNLLLAV